jgi:hypothetical protein
MMRNSIAFLLLMSATTIITGCQPLPFMESPKSSAQTQMVTGHQQVGPFTAIVVDGPMDIDLVSQPPMARSHRLEYVSSRETAGLLVASVDNGTLYLRNMAKILVKGEPRPRIIVPVGELRSLNYNGSGVLTGRQIRTPNLTTLNAHGGIISLSGSNIPLRSIMVSGGGNVSISGIKTPRTLTVRGKDTSRITLTGTAQAIEVILSLYSWLDARSLRAENGFVNTAENARADVNVRHSLNAFATGNSNIYYHQQQPELLSKYLRHASSVLYFQEN